MCQHASTSCCVFFIALQSVLVTDTRAPCFSRFIKPKLKLFCPDLPEHDDLYQMAVDAEQVAFVRVQEIVPPFTYDDALPFFNLIVPTVESTTNCRATHAIS